MLTLFPYCDIVIKVISILTVSDNPLFLYPDLTLFYNGEVPWEICWSQRRLLQLKFLFFVFLSLCQITGMLRPVHQAADTRNLVFWKIKNSLYLPELLTPAWRQMADLRTFTSPVALSRKFALILFTRSKAQCFLISDVTLFWLW